MLNNLGALQSGLLLQPSKLPTRTAHLRNSSYDTTAAQHDHSAVVIWANKLSVEVDTWVQTLARSECNKVSAANNFFTSRHILLTLIELSAIH